METVAPGFRRPRQLQPLSADAEKTIAAACPGAVVAPWPDSPETHPYWGKALSVGTGYAEDRDLRFEASSGGVISALLIHALRSGAVERVLHVAPDPANPAANVIAISTTEEQVRAGAGSRYSSSSPLQAIDDVLTSGGPLAFVGKPCDVSALRLLGRIDPRVSRSIPLAFSFFCGGIPSDRGVDRILAAHGRQRQELVSFRYRGHGWPGGVVATMRDGAVASMSYAESWGDYLSKEIQFRCKICPDAVAGVADIACGDAWHADEQGYPLFDEGDGRSLVIARSEIGAGFLADAVSAGAISLKSLEMSEIDRMQPAQARRKRLVLSRSAAMALMLQPTPDMNGNSVGRAARKAGKIEQIRNFLGTIRRIAIGRR